MNAHTPDCAPFINVNQNYINQAQQQQLGGDRCGLNKTHYLQRLFRWRIEGTISCPRLLAKQSVSVLSETLACSPIHYLYPSEHTIVSDPTTENEQDARDTRRDIEWKRQAWLTLPRILYSAELSYISSRRHSCLPDNLYKRMSETLVGSAKKARLVPPLQALACAEQWRRENWSSVWIWYSLK